jgi:hypothetical protein|tara:strand:+ start:354 stop:530 length:177 start_codon:yes stop_codon:yes gene_type:complete
MKTWKVKLVKVFHQVATIELAAETEQEAIEEAEMVADQEEEWSDHKEVEQFVERAETI